MPTQSSAKYPPLDGSVLFPSLVDFNLQHNASLLAFVYSEAVGSLTEISFLEFGRAAHRAAHRVRPGQEGPQGEVVAIIANIDVLLYETLIAGLMQARLVPLLISPTRNSPEALVGLLQKCGCHRILTTHASLGALMAGIGAVVPPEHSLSIQEVPTLAQCYPFLGHETAADAFTPYPASAAPPEMDGVVLIMHSSGSTGHPKPILHTNRAMLGWCASDVVVDLRRTSRISGMHAVPYHVSGLTLDLLVPMCSLTSVSLYPPTSFYEHATAPVVATSNNIIEHCERTGVTGIVSVPSYVETWASEPESVEWLKTKDFLVFGGGPLSVKAGDTLSRAGVRLVSLYGATEFGIVTKVLSDTAERSEAWSYMEFSGNTNVRWIPQADGSFESQFLDTEVHTVSVYNLPDVKGYTTNDCWVPHPTKPNCWRIIGRLDDVFILASAENMVPAPLENMIMSSPLVTGAVIFSQSPHHHVGLLLEPAPGVAVGDLAEFRNRIWPLVEEAHKYAPKFGRVIKETIIVTAADRPMERADKGTVAKKATMKAYAAEIAALYDTVEASARQSNLPPA